MALAFVDRYSNTLASGYTSGGTSISVTSATGLPSGSTDFYVIVQADGGNTEEVFKVTNVSGTTLTVVGAQAGTSASNHGAGAVIIASVMCKDAYTQFATDVSGGTPGGSATEWQYNNTTFGGLVGTSAIPQTGWTVINGGSGAADYEDFSSAHQSLFVNDNASLNWRLITRSLPASNSYTAIARLRGTVANPLNNSQTFGLYLSDGTKLEGIEILCQGGGQRLRVEKMNSVTSDNATLAGPTGSTTGSVITLKIVGDATNRTFYYWRAGAYVQFFQEAIATFLTETTVGFGGLSVVGSTAYFVNVELLYWSLTNP
jgi:hypothetical protein